MGKVKWAVHIIFNFSVEWLEPLHQLLQSLLLSESVGSSYVILTHMFLTKEETLAAREQGVQEGLQPWWGMRVHLTSHEETLQHTQRTHVFYSLPGTTDLQLGVQGTLFSSGAWSTGACPAGTRSGGDRFHTPFFSLLSVLSYDWTLSHH